MTSQSVMVSEVCVSAIGGWKQAGSRRELFAKYRKRAGRSGSVCRVSGTDVDTQYETPRHDRARCATILKKTTKRARRTAHMHTALDGTSTPRCGCTSLRVRGTAETSPLQEQGGETRTCSYHFRAVVQVWLPLASRLCDHSAEPRGNKWRASIGHRRQYHKVNKTVTEINLYWNNLGDGGAIALAESFKATLVMKIPPLRATLFLGPARSQLHRRR